MSWPYHFISLSEDQKLHRRELLDLRGYYAQLSIVLVMLAIRTVRFARPSTTKRDGKVSGNLRRYLVCGVWLLWLLSLSVWESGKDYLHLTKALGHVGLSQLPLQVLASPADVSNPAASSVISVVTGISQRALTPYHRLFGRIIVFLLFAHATLYMLFFVQSSHPELGTLLFKRVQDDDVQCGMVAIFSAVLLLFFVRPTSPQAIKSWLVQGPLQERKKMFYYGHVSLVVLLSTAAYFHVQQAQKYILQTLAASVVNWACSRVVG